jgi:hypothetical protein
MAESEPRERIGTVLRALAADLVTEKQRVARLKKENEQLRAELEALRHIRGKRPGSEDHPRTSFDLPDEPVPPGEDSIPSAMSSRAISKAAGAR